ncbi:hypothetical protein BgAZ_400010 [Babesia gibsoni]|uniref:Uncharacterized protein n=1 Tax=Babesia gibsoni TaxID=33632 RepID=A0AAD8LNG0_BABGI|nr:hypothetical protein BgAZ_400010 [Babesia gibsoni]
MGSVNVHSNLLSRTKFAQSRTAYYTVRNTLIGAHQRQMYLVEPFELMKSNRQLGAIRKAYAARRSSRRGPFQKLLPPHVYSQVFGDPTYYSVNELCKTCGIAADMQLRDRTFWWQICEKLRKVRDIMDIRSLLSCISSVIRVKYFDPDLMRMLSREFVDDMHKLSVSEIGELMHCYVVANVYSIDLVNAAGAAVSSRLMRHVENVVNPGTLPAAEHRGHQPAYNSVDDTFKEHPETLGLLTKCFAHFGYKNRDLYLSIAYLAIKHWDMFDLYEKCAIFGNLDPKDFEPSEVTNKDADSQETAMEISLAVVSRMNQLLAGLTDDYCPKLLHLVTDEVDATAIMPPNQSEEMEDYAKAIYNLCSVSGATRSLAHVVCRILGNADYVRQNNGSIRVDESLESVMSVLVKLSSELMTSAKEFHSEAKKRYRSTTLQMIKPNEIAPLGNQQPYMCPSVSATYQVFMESTLRMVSAVNASLRSRVGEKDLVGVNALQRYNTKTNAVIRGDDIKSSDMCLNIHSALYDCNMKLSEKECVLIGHFMDAVENYGCQCHNPELLTTAYETIALLSRMNCEACMLLSQRAQHVQDVLSLCIVKDLLSYKDEERYRIMLALKNSKLAPSCYLDHALEKFTRFFRMSKCGTAFSCNQPYKNIMKPSTVQQRKIITNENI